MDHPVLRPVRLPSSFDLSTGLIDSALHSCGAIAIRAVFFVSSGRRLSPVMRTQLQVSGLRLPGCTSTLPSTPSHQEYGGCGPCSSRRPVLPIHLSDLQTRG